MTQLVLGEYDDASTNFESFVVRLNLILGLALIVALSDRSSISKCLRGDQLLHPTLLIFLSVYVLFAAGDWCQGPYFHAIYVQKNISEQNIAMIFTAGYVSAMLFGWVVGPWIDILGRKKSCTLFALLFILSALSTSSSNYGVLILGRVCGGAASSLLHTAPEAWLVSEMKRHNVPKNQNSFFFGAQHFFSFVSAICVGQITHHLESRVDTFATFQLSACLVCVGTIIMFVSWRENYGINDMKMTGKKQTSNHVSAYQIIRNDMNVFLVGFAQSFFDSAVYIFVLLWSSMLRQASFANNIQRIPFGQIFSAFMMCLMLGSCVQNTLSSKIRKRVFLYLSCFMILAAMCLAFCTSESVRFDPIVMVVLFCVFEFIVGLYKPVLASARSMVITCHVRSAVMALFRVPLNMMVILTYSAYSSGLLDQKSLMLVASTFIILSSISVFALYRRSLSEGRKKL